MATKIRLQRFGRKGYAFYQVVVADSRAPRDGKFIERIGSYNPNTNPATIDLNFERALYWLQTGAQPTDTARNILSKEGILLKKHLAGGVKKGAFTAEEADARFEKWSAAKQAATLGEKSKLSDAAKTAAAKRLEAEKEVNKAKAEALASKKAAAVAPAVEEVAEVEAPVVEEAPVAEAAAEVETPVVEEAPVAEAATDETTAAE
ncbi:MAG: 30S ribosomal protein S16 [Bacteroidales bacterium]